MTGTAAIVYGFSIFTGLVFALLAYGLAIKASNLLAEKADLKVGFGKLSVSIGNALVALFAISAALTVAVPLYMFFLSGQDVPIQVTIKPSDSAAVPSVVESTPNYEIYVYRTRWHQDFALSFGCSYQTVNVKAWFERPEKLHLVVNEGADAPQDANDNVTIPVAVNTGRSETCHTAGSDTLTKPKPEGNAVLTYPAPVQQQVGNH